jgi:signal transduction histidine kinase
MDLNVNIFSITLIFSGFLVAFLSVIIALKMDGGTKWLAVTMICRSIWGVFYGFELASKDLNTILFYIKIQYLGISFLAASWLIFSFKYTEIDLTTQKTVVFFTLLIPVITYTLVVTNDYHHLIYESYELVTFGTITGLKAKVGLWYFVHVIYSYLAFGLGNFIIWKRFRYSGQTFKTQTQLLFIAGLFPIGFNALYQFGIYSPLEIIDLTPYAFLFTYLIIGIAILRYHLFSIKPIAKDIIFNAITKGVLVLDRKHNIVDFNPAIHIFFDDQESISIGVNAKMTFRLYPELLNILDDLTKQELNISSGHGDDQRVVKVAIIPLEEKRSTQKGTIILFEEITEEVKTKELLIAQKNELEQLNNLKDKYFGIISHDLKGPIFGIKALIHHTQTGLISNEEFIELLPEMSKNIDNVSQLLESLLTWTSLQFRGEQVILESFDVRIAMIRQQQLLNQMANEKNISILVDVPESEFNILADKNMVDLILRNLVNNAVKFSKPSSEIKLSAEITEGYTKICVEDSGKGISSEDIKKITDGISFSTRGYNNENGTGLGLILVREYTKKNFGKLHVESIINVGSKFYIYLQSAV